uniref:MSP domain-containing protein n=1 Tax=Aegilops tauschii subsp. strangulata TaxID=200361 RepID=A0A453CP36_AEGTS
MSSTLLRVCPSELKIPYEVKRQRSCCMQLINKTDKYVAFKVKTTNPRKYSVRHTCGILLPRSSCSVTVTMQAPRDMQLDHHCKDKFLVQSAVARDGATMRDLVPELVGSLCFDLLLTDGCLFIRYVFSSVMRRFVQFTRAPGRLIEEFKLRVVYIAANPPSPVPEEAEEEDASPRSEVTMGYEAKVSSAFDAASRCMDNSGAKPSCTKGASVVPTLVGEKVSTREENQKRLQQNMELLREAGSPQQGFSVMFVLLVFMSSVFIGHLMKHIKV